MNVLNRVGRSLTNSVRLTETGLEVRYPYGTVLVALVPTLLFGLLITHGNYPFVGALAVFGLTFAPLTYILIRLTADDKGVRIVNYGFTTRVAWSDIADFELSTSRYWGYGRRSQLRIRLSDGRVVKPLATRQGLSRYGTQQGYSEGQLERIVERLRSLQRRHLGVQDAPELTDALRAAETGNPDPLDHLLASGRITQSEYSYRLHELAAAGKVDLEALRRTRRQEIDAS